MDKKKIHEWALTVPSLIWLTILFIIPTLLVFAMAFRPPDPWGGIGEGWTLHTIISLGNPNYPAIVWRTVWISVVTTLVCLFFAIPAGYFMARVDDRWQRLLVLAVVIPFWTSFLIRIFAWKTLLHPEGYIKQVLVYLQIVEPSTSLLYGSGTVLLVMVYTFLPFAILPVYAAAEKFDFHLIEAARDLGASRMRAFFSIFLPGVRRGILTAILVVFIPALGSYVVPDIVGGPNSEMIGNKIAQRAFVDRNLPHASGLSAILTVVVLLPLLAVPAFRRKQPQKPELIIAEDA